MINWIISDINEFINYIGVNQIYLDVDGVLFHSCQAICDIINEDKGTNVLGKDILSWNFKEICPNLTDTDIENLFVDDRFFKYVQWINGAKDFIKRHEGNITIVTKGTKQNILKKYDIFNLYNFNVTIKGLSLNESKSKIDMSNGIFIDDCTQNLIESNAKYKVQFLEYNDNLNEYREWIKGWNGYKMFKWS